MDRGFFITSITKSFPTDITVIVASPAASFIFKAASTAFSQNPLTTGGMPWAGTTLLAASSTLKADSGVSGSITCLAQTMMFKDMGYS
jgi:hypothetical protein